MDSSSAIVGYSGFVGSHLHEQLPFAHRFNSTNSMDMAGKKFSTVFFSAAPAEKWKANANPEDDFQKIESLIQLLQSFRADRIVLISTIDVYDIPNGVDESFEPNQDTLHPYGLNRLKLEKFVGEEFKDHTILRLPALFGERLKKNAIFDLINGNQVEKIDSRGQFQFYNMNNIGVDAMKAVKLGMPVLNLSTQPLIIEKVAKELFGKDLNPGSSGIPPLYNVFSLYAKHWGGSDYLYSAENVLSDLRQFVNRNM